LDMIEALIGLIWLAVFVSSIVRGISRGLRRAEQEAARRAGRRVGSPPVGFPTQWPAGGGRQLGPVIIVDRGDDGEGASSTEEGAQLEEEPAWDYEADPAGDHHFEAHDHDAGEAMCESEAAAEPGYVREPYEKVRAWDPTRIDGSLVAEDDHDAGLIVASPGADGMWAELEGDDESSLDWPDSPEGWSKAAVAGIVWSVVLDRPRTRVGTPARK
jgi:hypothetical protein